MNGEMPHSAPLGIHCGAPQLLWHHLSKTLQVAQHPIFSLLQMKKSKQCQILVVWLQTSGTRIVLDQRLPIFHAFPKDTLLLALHVILCIVRDVHPRS